MEISQDGDAALIVNFRCVSFYLQVWRMWPSSWTWRLSFISHTLSWPSRCLFSHSRKHTETYIIQILQYGTEINSITQLWWRNVENRSGLWRTVGREEGGRGGWVEGCEVKSLLSRGRPWQCPAGFVPVSLHDSQNTHFQCVSCPILFWNSLHPFSNIITLYSSTVYYYCIQTV